MRPEHEFQTAALQPAKGMTLAAFNELQADCREIADRGGEAGSIASDIGRLSARLWALCKKAEQALGR